MLIVLVSCVRFCISFGGFVDFYISGLGLFDFVVVSLFVSLGGWVGCNCLTLFEVCFICCGLRSFCWICL